jgi:hypothetical protein
VVPFVLRGRQRPARQEDHQQLPDHRPPGTEDRRENRHDEYGDQQRPQPPDVREGRRVDPCPVALGCRSLIGPAG